MSQINASLPLLGFAAFSGTGKTTLLEAMLPKLSTILVSFFGACQKIA